MTSEIDASRSSGSSGPKPSTSSMTADDRSSRSSPTMRRDISCATSWREPPARRPRARGLASSRSSVLGSISCEQALVQRELHSFIEPRSSKCSAGTNSMRSSRNCSRARSSITGYASAFGCCSVRARAHFAPLPLPCCRRVLAGACRGRARLATLRAAGLRRVITAGCPRCVLLPTPPCRGALPEHVVLSARDASSREARDAVVGRNQLDDVRARSGGTQLL